MKKNYSLNWESGHRKIGVDLSRAEKESKGFGTSGEPNVILTGSRIM